jgi:signal transduction histidine kinase
MEPRLEQGKSDLRGAPRRARESSGRFAEEDLRLQVQQLRESLRQAREELEDSNRTRSEFLALLSHEFRTPLQAIFGYTELLEREIHGPLNPAQRRDLLRIQESQQHLLGLVTTFLEVAREDHPALGPE